MERFQSQSQLKYLKELADSIPVSQAPFSLASLEARAKVFAAVAEGETDSTQPLFKSAKDFYLKVAQAIAGPEYQNRIRVAERRGLPMPDMETFCQDRAREIFSTDLKVALNFAQNSRRLGNLMIEEAYLISRLKTTLGITHTEELFGLSATPQQDKIAA